jgi:hypothetical protein
MARITPSIEQIAHEIRQIHDTAAEVSQEHLRYELRSLYRWITCTDPWPETRQ